VLVAIDLSSPPGRHGYGVLPVAGFPGHVSDRFEQKDAKDAKKRGLAFLLCDLLFILPGPKPVIVSRARR
jgi:hypothetical protein